MWLESDHENSEGIEILPLHLAPQNRGSFQKFLGTKKSIQTCLGISLNSAHHQYPTFSISSLYLGTIYQKKADKYSLVLAKLFRGW